MKVVAFREATGFCPLFSVGHQHGGISDHNLFKVSVCEEQPENRIHLNLHGIQKNSLLGFPGIYSLFIP